MIEIKNIEIFGLERSLRASGNDLSVGDIDTTKFFEPQDSDRGIRRGSVEAGKGHDHFLSGITVYFDMKYSPFWLMEASRYTWFNIVSSQNLPQRLVFLANRSEFDSMFNKYVEVEIIEKIKMYVNAYNISVNDGDPSYEWFMRALSNLPMGFELWMTVSTNYLQLKTMYMQRRSSRLEEDWGVFLRMCEGLPSFLELIGEEKV